MANVPLLDAQGNGAYSDLVFTALSDHDVQINIGHDFAGRDVEEELDLDTLIMLGGDEPFRCNKLLGLSFQTDGEQITGSVGAGSANFGFVISKSAWNSALAALKGA